MSPYFRPFDSFGVEVRGYLKDNLIAIPGSLDVSAVFK